MRTALKNYAYTVLDGVVFHQSGYWRGVLDDDNKVAYLTAEVGIPQSHAEGYRTVIVRHKVYTPYERWNAPETVGDLMAALLLGSMEVLLES